MRGSVRRPDADSVRRVCSSSISASKSRGLPPRSPRVSYGRAMAHRFVVCPVAPLPVMLSPLTSAELKQYRDGLSQRLRHLAKGK